MCQILWVVLHPALSHGSSTSEEEELLPCCVLIERIKWVNFAGEREVS